MRLHSVSRVPLLLSLLVGALLASPLRAEVNVQQLAGSVVAIRVERPDGEFSGGTGVVVAEDGALILATALHVVSPAGSEWASRVSVRSHLDGNWRRLGEYADALDNAVDRDRDLAAFALKRVIPGVRPATRATLPVEVGDRLVMFGYSDSRGVVRWGEVRGLDARRPYIAARLGAQPGDSGGPVFDASTGRLVAIVSGQLDRRTTSIFACVVNGAENVCEWNPDAERLEADSLLGRVR